MCFKIKRPSPGSDPVGKEDTAPANNPFTIIDPGDMHPEHSAAMTLGMLSGSVTPAPPTLFDTVRSPGGTVYPAFDLGNLGSSGSGSGSGMTPDFSGDLLGGDPGASPFSSMFNNMGNANMDFTNSLDWVWHFPPRFNAPTADRSCVHTGCL